jgi:uncharacterized protein YdeI (YjbR/CyaY-like superfamily)
MREWGMVLGELKNYWKMKEAPIKAFATPVAWRAWLEKNHTKPAGIWIIFYKKTSGKKSISYAQALDEALCFGWIDGQSKGIDEASWKQRFTPRRTKSIWSKRNREHVARLIKEKRMTPAGLKEIAAAKQDGRWESAYDSPKTMDVPADFLRELRRDPGAYAFYETLNRASIYAIAWRLQTAKKPETRMRRMEALLSMLKAGKKFH